MDATPIMEFKNIHEAVACLKEWQERLGLSDWIIQIDLCHPREPDWHNAQAMCDWRTVNKTALVSIIKPEFSPNQITKYCAEKFLVHELLHCTFSILQTQDEGFNTLLHRTQEDLAKALIMAKYGVKHDYFSDIHYEEDKSDG